MSRNFELLVSLGEKPLPPPGMPEVKALDPTVAYSVISPVNASEEEIQIVQRIFLLPGSEAPRSVVFCGVTEERESALLCARVGEILASDASRRVCLVDANVYLPSLDKRYGIPAEPGFADAAVGTRPVKDIAHQVSHSNLWLVPSRHQTVERTAAVWSPERLRDRWAQIRIEFDFVVACAPAVHSHPEAIALGRISDGVVLVLEENSTRREVAQKVKENLEASGVRVLGAVVTHHTEPIPAALDGIL